MAWWMYKCRNKKGNSNPNAWGDWADGFPDLLKHPLI